MGRQPSGRRPRRPPRSPRATLRPAEEGTVALRPVGQAWRWDGSEAFDPTPGQIVLRVDEDPGLTVDDGVPDPGDVEADRRGTNQSRLGDHNAPSLMLCRMHESPRLAQQAPFLLLVDPTGEDHTGTSRGLERGALGAITEHDQRPPTTGSTRSHTRSSRSTRLWGIRRPAQTKRGSWRPRHPGDRGGSTPGCTTWIRTGIDADGSRADCVDGELATKAPAVHERHDPGLGEAARPRPAPEGTADPIGHRGHDAQGPGWASSATTGRSREGRSRCRPGGPTPGTCGGGPAGPWRTGEGPPRSKTG